eukprot:7383161-Prymnesium_polylepis.1
MGRVIADVYMRPSSAHTAGLEGLGVQLQRQRVDDPSSGGLSAGVSMGVNPKPSTVTTVPPEMGPPVGSMLSTDWRYCRKRWKIPTAEMGQVLPIDT